MELPAKKYALPINVVGVTGGRPVQAMPISYAARYCEEAESLRLPRFRLPIIHGHCETGAHTGRGNP